MRCYFDSRGKPLQPGLYTWADNDSKVTMLVSPRKGNNSRYDLISANGFPPDLQEQVARRLRPLSSIEIKALLADPRDLVWLKILSGSNSAAREIIRKSLDSIK